MKRICKAYSVNDKNFIQLNLNNHNIKSEVKSKGANIFERVTDKIYWFEISVDKSDYESAKQIIKELPEDSFEKELKII